MKVHGKKTLALIKPILSTTSTPAPESNIMMTSDWFKL